MTPFRFSPIRDESELMNAITYIHFACHTLCMQSMGRYLPVAGNIGVFSHYDEEYEFLKKLQAELTDLSQNVYGKYFLLHKPIVIPAKGEVPEATYKYLYIRKPDPEKYHVGDVDFYLEPTQYAELKQALQNGKIIRGARKFPDRPNLDVVELYDDAIDAWGYIGDKKWY